MRKIVKITAIICISGLIFCIATVITINVISSKNNSSAPVIMQKYLAKTMDYTLSCIVDPETGVEYMLYQSNNNQGSSIMVPRYNNDGTIKIHQ